jgi:alkaline phosphatase D
MRRGQEHVITFLFSLIVLAVSRPSHGDVYLTLSPMLGHVGHDEARVWVKASGAARVSVLIGREKDLSDARLVEGPQLSHEADFMGHVVVKGLRPETRYYYSVLLDGEPALARPYPFLRMAPPPGTGGKFRFGFVSCVGRYAADAGAGWGDMAERADFDFLLMLGDNHYADTTDATKQREAYYAHRGVAGFRKVATTRPTYGIWDDHDYGPNNSDSTVIGRDVTLRTFKQFWANPAYGQNENDGVYFRFSRGDVDFFMLDVRYHRWPNKATDDGGKTMLGAGQLAWLKRELLASKAKVKFVASGSEWQTDSQPDSWKSFDRERQEIWRFIRDNGIKGIVFLSGDRHFTAAYQIQKRFIEVTTGPIGSGNAKTKNVPEMILHHNDGKFYCVFDVDTTAAEPALVLEVYRAGYGLVEKRPFTWAQLNGEETLKTLPVPPVEDKKPAATEADTSR